MLNVLLGLTIKTMGPNYLQFAFSVILIRTAQGSTQFPALPAILESLAHKVHRRAPFAMQAIFIPAHQGPANNAIIDTTPKSDACRYLDTNCLNKYFHNAE